MSFASAEFQTNVQNYINQSKRRAIKYLETSIESVTDEYELALVTYALTLSRGKMASDVYKMLLQKSSTQNGMIFWSPNSIDTNK